MDVQPAPLVITLVLLAAIWAGMVLAWRARRRRQAGLAVPADAADYGVAAVSVDGLYLATTFAERPLERVAAAGLGFRARTTLTVTDLGVLVDRDGAPPLFLPVADIDGAGVATWTIDRTVERNGLTVIRWRMHDDAAGPVLVESSFRLELEPRAELLAAITALKGAPSHADA